MLKCSNDLDVFFIAEAEIRFEFDLSCLYIDGYDIALSNTIDSRKKSRLICFKKANIEVIEIENELDDIICLGSGDITVIGLYRGFKCFENETVGSNFARILKTLDRVDFKKRVYIIGDFNIDMMKLLSPLKDDLLEWCDSHDMKLSEIGVTRARWVAGNLQESCLDYLLSNDDKFKLEKEMNVLSDHYILKLSCFQYNKVIREKIKVEVSNWNFDKVKANAFLSEYLETVPIMSTADVELIDYWIRAGLLKTLKEMVKVRTITCRNSNEVVTVKIVKLRNWKNKLQKNIARKRLLKIG